MKGGLIIDGFHGAVVDLGGEVIVVVPVPGSVLRTFGASVRPPRREMPSSVCVVEVGWFRVAGLVIIQEVIVAEAPLLLLFSVLDVPPAAVEVLVIVEVLVVVSQ